MATPTAPPRAGRAALAVATAAALVFVAVGIVAAQRPLPRWDHDAVQHALTWDEHADLVLRVVMQFGTTSVAIVLAVLIGVLRRSLRWAVAVLGSAFAASWAASGAKHIWTRPRPGVAFGDIAPRIFTAGYGFPSGHATVAAAVAVTLAGATPRRWWALFAALALGTAVARVAFGVHFVIDVVGGLALGASVGALAVWFARRSIG